MTAVFKFDAGTELAAFVSANSFVDVIMGPLGSGKTVGLCTRIMRHAQEQKPSPLDGLRKTRFFIARNTYPALKQTTIRTWLDTFPEHLHGRFNWGQTFFHRIRFPWPGGDVQTEIDFLALDKAEDVRKLRSSEYTGGAFNELPFIPKEIFDEATSRVGRYPRMIDGGPTWRGVIADANAPDEDNWLAYMRGLIELPPGLTEEEAAHYVWPREWGFFQQPPALLEKCDERGMVVGYEPNPNAENVVNLPKDYYAKQLAGKTKAWIDSRLMVRVVLVVEGSPVWPMFKPEIHVARDPLYPIITHPVTVGLDFGRQPAAIFMQAVNNRILVQFELIGHNEGAITFAPKVRRFFAEKYPDHSLSALSLFGDPKGQDRTQNDDRTAYDIFGSNGLFVRPAPGLKGNMIDTRVQAVAKVLNEMYDGRPRFVLSPYCRTLKVGMAGRYHLVKEDQGEMIPKKDRYADPCDALQYGMLGLGEGREMVRPLGGPRGPISTRPKERRSMRRLTA